MTRTVIVEVPTSRGCHYDYDRQTWRDGHDHYHERAGSSVRLYCGQALAGCKRAGGDPALSAMPALAADVPSILAADSAGASS